MDFKPYYEALAAEARKGLAADLGTSVPYLSQIAHGHRRPSPPMARAIETATGGAVKRHELRPDIFDAPRKGRAA